MEDRTFLTVTTEEPKLKSSSEPIEPLFRNAHEALVYAYNFSHQQYPRSPMFRVILQSRGGRGLGGLDGAAQARMIKQEVEQLDRLEQAFIVARFAPASVSCDCGRSCCSGKRSNEEWTHAIGVLSLHLKEVVLLGCKTTIDMRVDYLNRFFFPKNVVYSIDAMSKEHHVAKNTICNHLASVKRFLLGEKINGAKQAGLEERAMTAITDRLEQAGIIGKENL